MPEPFSGLGGLCIALPPVDYLFGIRRRLLVQPGEHARSREAPPSVSSSISVLGHELCVVIACACFSNIKGRIHTHFSYIKGRIHTHLKRPSLFFCEWPSMACCSFVFLPRSPVMTLIGAQSPEVGVFCLFAFRSACFTDDFCARRLSMSLNHRRGRGAAHAYAYQCRRVVATATICGLWVGGGSQWKSECVKS
jgi:hypothetical protein